MYYVDQLIDDVMTESRSESTVNRFKNSRNSNKVFVVN